MRLSRELISCLLQSVYSWCCDNGLRTMLLVRDGGQSVLPRRHVQSNGFIVLDISSAAVQGLEFGADAVSFDASFDGERFAVEVANEEVVCIGSLERNIGLVLPADWMDGLTLQDMPGPAKADDASGSEKKDRGGRPDLKLI